MQAASPSSPGASAPIGLYDSGLGGLSVARALAAALPHERFAYVGDTARVPYGGREASEIRAFNDEIVRFLLDAGVKAIVIACNTSSALALEGLRAWCPVPIWGVVEPGAAAAVAAGADVGVVATEGTVRSEAYVRAIHALAPRVRVRQLAAPAWVPLVEGGRWAGPEAEAAVAQALAPWAGDWPEALILGCTHYPFLAEAIRSVVGSGVTLVDPASATVATLEAGLAERGLLASAPTGGHRIFASADAAGFARRASALVGRDVALPPTEPIAWRSAPLTIAPTAR